MNALLGWVRRAVTLLVVAIVILLLARYAMEFPPVLAWDRFGVSDWLTATLDPVLAPLRDLPGLSAPDIRAHLPLGLAVLLLITQLVLNHTLLAPRASPARPRRSTAPPPPTPPVPPMLAEGGTEILPSTAPATGAPATGTMMLPTTVPPAEMPSRIGRYEILSVLGQGAMGTVYKAQDPQIGRLVAIKTILARRSTDPTVEAFRKRFEVEARAAGRLNHPGIVSVHDVIQDEYGSPCQVLEFIEGQTLDDAVGQAPLGLDRSLEILGQVADALDYAHRKGIVHRDIKPGNIMLDTDGRAKVSDFGIAKIDDTNLTATGMVVGTPAFMSPEQCAGQPLDHRTDLFSLGGVLYWILAGRKPFDGTSLTTVVYKVVHEDPVPLRQHVPDLPEDLEQFTLRCLAKNRDDRPTTAAALAAELQRIRAARQA